LIYSAPSLTDAAYKKFYESDFYRQAYSDADPLAYAELRFSSRSDREIYEHVERFLNEKKGPWTILEFGCGGGWNLVPFAEQGHQISGLDYSEQLTRFGRSKGLNIQQGSIESISGYFDLIIVNHVIEHFVDIEEQIRSIAAHLTEGGLLYIGVPNMDNFSRDQFQNAHVYYFTPRTFLYYMSRIGLKLEEFGPSSESYHMYGVFRKSDLISDAPRPRNEFMRMLPKIAKMKVRYWGKRVFGRPT